MKLNKLAAFAAGLLVVAPAFAQSSTHVRGYHRKDGTYVAPHRRTTPDSSRSNNWSTRGNVNPYTGREGTKDPYSSTSSRSRSSTSPYGGSLYGDDGQD